MPVSLNKYRRFSHHARQSGILCLFSLFCRCKNGLEGETRTHVPLAPNEVG
jgi:hypothetical protein